MKSKTQKEKSKALIISTETHNKVYERDKGCILCQMLGEHEKFSEDNIMPPLECHHYIPRSRLGMGIEENLVMLCYYHHKEETRYRKAIRKHLKSKYENWNEEDLIYKKWR